ncbi:MAG: hypothetical protein GY866_35220, partial [Proteobacteria bacterium]|nr:hypothetical protein [Pseudomonadota bacterium]
MKTSVKIFSIVSIMALVSLFISNAGAQVVTPSLNPMAPVDMAAAAGWRTIPTVGISYFDSIGNRSYNGENIYEFTGSGTMANLSFKAWERFAFEGFYYADSTTVAKDEYYDGVINLKTADTRLNFSLAHG